MLVKPPDFGMLKASKGARPRFYEVNLMSIGNKLAEARKAANLTQEQLAERLGVTRQAVSRWESDAAYPETDKIVRMARLLNVSCDYLLRVGGRGGRSKYSFLTGRAFRAIGALSWTLT